MHKRPLCNKELISSLAPNDPQKTALISEYNMLQQQLEIIGNRLRELGK